MGNAEQIQRQIAEDIKPNLASATEGLVVEQDWDNGLVTVNVGGTEQRMKWALAAPWPGDKVRIVSAGGAAFCIPVYGAPLGTVQFTGSGGAVVLADDGVTYTYPHLGAAPADGARVRLDHAGRCVLSGVYAVEPEDSEFVRTVAPPAAGGGEAWFHPVWSGNFRPGFAGAAVEISSSRMGMYGYGTQIADTIPDSAALMVAELHLVQTWDNVPGVASSMGLHGFNGMPGSADNGSLSGAVGVAGGNQVVNLLGSFANSLKTGAAFGVGFRSGSSGWRQYAAAPTSGRIFMRWN